MGWLDFIKKQPIAGKATIDPAVEKEFWGHLLGELLLEKKQKSFENAKKAANRLALEPRSNTADRDEALKELDTQKREYAKFANETRAQIQQEMKADLQSHRHSNIKQLEQQYTAEYNKRLQDNAIAMHNETQPVTQTADGFKNEYLRLVKLDHCTTGCTGACSCPENDDALAIIEKDQEEKLRAMNHSWWAIWGALKNSKYFSLSCGTTMGGALIIIAAPFGTTALIIATIVAVPVVYIVTRADWWLTNRALPELALELANPKEFLKKFWAKLKARPLSTLYNLVITSIVTIVWAALTYDTTLELTKQLYEKSTIGGGLASTMVLGITGVMAAVAAWKLYKSYTKNNKLYGLKSIWALALAAATAGLGYWVLGAESVEFQKASVLAITVMMTFFTAPAVYTVFNLYTDKFIKAFHGPIDSETGEDNEFHYKNVDKSFDAIVKDARENNGLGKFKTTYNVIMGIGMFIATGVAFMLQQTMMGQELSFTSLPDFNSMFFGSMAASLGLVGIAIKAVFEGINSYTGVNAYNQKDKDMGISKDMLYKALVVLGIAALIGTFAIVTASNHMMGNIFTKWLGAPDSAVPILNGVFTMGIGFLGAAGFYFGSAINTVKKLFTTTHKDPDLTDPTGKNRQPDFTKTVYENKTLAAKVAHRVGDSLNWFGTDPTPKEAEMTIYGNGVANSFQTIMSASSTSAAVVFSTAATVASVGANVGMDNTVPMPLPDVKKQANVVEMIRVIRRS